MQPCDMATAEALKPKIPQDASARGSLNYKICGVDVEFPYKPYGPQLAYMGKVLAALEQSRVKRNGSVNALLESPTGSGKTLALLCATLAWQQQFESMPPLPAAVVTDPLVGGGGFIVEDGPPGPENERENNPAAEQQKGGRFNKQAPKKRKAPVIYYATRTHTQITQVIREFRKTKYRVPMAVLAARKHYCTNKHVVKKKNIDEDCKILLKDEGSCCPQFKNVMKLKTHSSLQKGGPNDVHDIEDLVGLGHKVKGCAYFAARALATEADIVFCPYSYILDPIIRRAMEVNLDGAIVVLDEAHNIEDVAREAGSIDLETGLLQDLRLELEQLASSDETADIYSPLLEMVQAMLDWIYHQETSLSKLDFEHYASSWRGDKAVQELRAAGISLETFQIFVDCCNKAVGAASNPDETVNHLSGRAAIALEGLFSALKLMLSNNGRRTGDYQLVVKKYVKRDEGLAVAGWVTTISLWCLNPGVVFEDIATASRTIILTSGTLSPMDSFASELGVPFEIQMEAPHVVDMDKQVWAAAVSTGPDNISLNASYKNADGYAFQDALGIVLEEVFKVVPDGALTFFPSYKLLDKLCARWKSTGQWSRLSNQKELFVEPRGNNDQFEQILQDFYKAVNTGGKPPDRNVKGGAGKKRDRKSQNLSAGTCRRAGGAAFLAVCRGKVSEGIDFSDKNARVVVIIGIPFPNVKDIQVTLKKQYNQENRVSKNLLSGDQWYCQQTFRALNQAVGRCIRHRYDYGAILLLDDRFKKPGNIEYMSKWLRKSIQHCENFKQSLEGLQTFFKGFEASSSDMKALNIVPTVKSTLISTYKAKLLITPSTGKPDNQRNLKGYIRKLQVSEASPAVGIQGLKSSPTAQSSPKDQSIVRKDQKAFPERRSKLSSAQQQTRVEVQERIAQKFGATEALNAEVAEHSVVPPGMREEPDSDYEVFSLRNDHILWAEQTQTAASDAEDEPERDDNGIEEHAVHQYDYLQLTQPPGKVAPSNVRSRCRNTEVTRSEEIARKGDSYGEGPVICLDSQDNEASTKEGALKGCKLAETENMHKKVVVESHGTLPKSIEFSRLLYRSPPCASRTGTSSAQVLIKSKEKNVQLQKHGQASPHHVADVVDLAEGKDLADVVDLAESEMDTCCMDVAEDRKTPIYAAMLRDGHSENPCVPSPRGQENEKPDEVFELRRRKLSEIHVNHEASAVDTKYLPEQKMNSLERRTHRRSRDFLAWMKDSSPQRDPQSDKGEHLGGQDDGQQFEELELWRGTSFEMHTPYKVPSVDSDCCVQRETSSPAGRLNEYPTHMSPQADSKWDHPVPARTYGRSDGASTPMVSTDRADSGLDASCSRRDQSSSEVVISCNRCLWPFSTPTKVSHMNLSKSHLVTLSNASGAALPKESLRLSVPVLTMEFDPLHSLLKESTSKAPRSVSSTLGGMSDSSSCGIWVKEDGCVYEHIFCPRCEDQSNCIGVRIAATDKANLSLMDKVVFLAQCVKVTALCPTATQQSTVQADKTNLSSLPTQAPTAEGEQSASKRARAMTPAKAKSPSSDIVIAFPVLVPVKKLNRPSWERTGISSNSSFKGLSSKLML